MKRRRFILQAYVTSLDGRVGEWRTIRAVSIPFLELCRKGAAQSKKDRVDRRILTVRGTKLVAFRHNSAGEYFSLFYRGGELLLRQEMRREARRREAQKAEGEEGGEEDEEYEAYLREKEAIDDSRRKAIEDKRRCLENTGGIARAFGSGCHIYRCMDCRRYFVAGRYASVSCRYCHSTRVR